MSARHNAESGDSAAYGWSYFGGRVAWIIEHIARGSRKSFAEQLTRVMRARLEAAKRGEPIIPAITDEERHWADDSLAKQTVDDWINKRPDVQLSSILLVWRAFPEISLEWLVVGRGADPRARTKDGAAEQNDLLPLSLRGLLHKRGASPFVWSSVAALFREQPIDVGTEEWDAIVEGVEKIERDMRRATARRVQPTLAAQELIRQTDRRGQKPR